MNKTNFVVIGAKVKLIRVDRTLYRQHSIRSETDYGSLAPVLEDGKGTL